MHGVNADSQAQLLWGIGVLVLAVSALTARRPSPGMVLRSLLAWGAIGVLITVAVGYRHELSHMLQRVGAALGLQEQRIEGDTVRIRQSDDGHFWAQVRLNGHPRRMLIDSGATVTALSQQTAAMAGVETDGRPVVLSTANGSVPAVRGAVRELTIGTIEARGLPVVVSASFGDLDVLGMNFLSRLESWRVERDTLILEPQPRMD
jgi:aspartyl protease family protein